MFLYLTMTKESTKHKEIFGIIFDLQFHFFHFFNSNKAFNDPIEKIDL